MKTQTKAQMISRTVRTFIASRKAERETGSIAHWDTMQKAFLQLEFMVGTESACNLTRDKDAFFPDFYTHAWGLHSRINLRALISAGEIKKLHSYIAENC